MRNRQSGISLLEGMVALSVGAILLLLAAPLYYRLASDRQVSAFTGELVAQLQKARHVAVYQGTNVSLCSSDNGRECTVSHWSRGYIVFRDGGEAGVVDGNDLVFKVVTGQEQALRVTLNGASHIRFQKSGGLVAGAAEPVRSVLPAPSSLATVLAAISPISTAHAGGPDSPAGSAVPPQAVAFRVCSGTVGRAVRVTTVGRLDTTIIECR